MGTWTTATVAECLVSVSMKGKAKIQTRGYKQSGRFPIVDQGQDRIAGWTDDEEAIIDTPLPLIVFGDHTRTFKFIDVPFARGADGTQLLAPTADINPLFFFYACKGIDLPARGYNRHFTILKEKEISYPLSMNEQIAIASVLQKAEAGLELQSVAIGRLQDLKRAAMQSLFSRGLRGEAQKETEIGPVPASWDVVLLGSLGRIGSGTTPDRKNPMYWHGSIPWITSGRMYEREITDSEECVTSLAIKDSSLPLLMPGAVLIAIVGQGKTLGHCALLNVEATVSRHVGYVQPNTAIVTPEFLRGYLEGQYDYLRQLASGNGSTRAALTAGILGPFPIPIPPTLDEQREIVAILDAIDHKIDLHRKKRAVFDELFKALLQKLMTGEIQVDDLDLSALGLSSAASPEAVPA